MYSIINPKDKSPNSKAFVRAAKMMRKIIMLKTLVKKSASICANATIVCGVTLGEYSMIGSGSVITKDVPAFALVVGNPGKIIGWVNRRGHRLQFDEGDISKCGNYKLKSKIFKPRLLNNNY